MPTYTYETLLSLFRQDAVILALPVLYTYCTLQSYPTMSQVCAVPICLTLQKRKQRRGKLSTWDCKLVLQVMLIYERSRNGSVSSLLYFCNGGLNAQNVILPDMIQGAPREILDNILPAFSIGWADSTNSSAMFQTISGTCFSRMKFKIWLKIA